MTRIFQTEHRDTSWQCVLTIDEDFKVENWVDVHDCRGAIKEMVEFWSGWESRVKENHGDYLQCFVKQLSLEIFIIQIENDYTLEGVIDEFKDREGWCPMDGSFGITITYCDSQRFNQDEFFVKEVPNA